MNNQDENAPSPEVLSSGQIEEDVSCESIDTQNLETKGSEDPGKLAVNQAINLAVNLNSDREQFKTEIQSSQSSDESCGKSNLTSAEKPNCYKCAYRGSVPGSAHSSCNHPLIADDASRFLSPLMFMQGIRPKAAKRLNVTAHHHGIQSGWFMWPLDFDPGWLISCDGFRECDK